MYDVYAQTDVHAVNVLTFEACSGLPQLIIADTLSKKVHSIMSMAVSFGCQALLLCMVGVSNHFDRTPIITQSECYCSTSLNLASTLFAPTDVLLSCGCL